MAAEAAHEAANPAQPRPRPKSGFYGVFANRKQWQAQIYHGGKRHNLGSFDTKAQAARTHTTCTRASTPLAGR